jgi:hypothetical protein
MIDARTSSGADYLASFGKLGDFGRFRAASDAFSRGQRVVIQASHGLELAVVLCRVGASHTSFLSQPIGDLVRLATADDERASVQMRDRSEKLFTAARRLAAQNQMAMEVLDVDIPLDGKQATIHVLRRDDCDPRPLVSALSREHDILIVLQNLALPQEVHEEPAGCGRPDCGQGGGGCSSCGEGGGCSTGHCSAGGSKAQISALLAGMTAGVADDSRTPLL